MIIVVQLSAADGIGAKKAMPANAEALKFQVFEGQVLPWADIVKEQSVAADQDALKVSRVLKAALSARQGADGSWVNNFRNRQETNVDLCTAHALITLSYTKPASK